MPIDSLSIEDFRNISFFRERLSPKLNIIRGQNAQGKTNFLEAIYYLANGKSFRSLENENLIRFGKDKTRLQAEITHQDLTSTLELELKSDERNIKFQNKPVQRYGKIHDNLRVLVFTPDSTSLFRSSPGSRRKYFDHAISVQKPGYSTLLSRYMRIVAHRNRLLENGNFLALHEFDSQWIQAYQELILLRQNYLEEILPFWRQRFLDLSGMDCELRASWESDSANYRYLTGEKLQQALENVREKERLLRHTQLGAQRDDLRLFFGEHSLRQVASQGQQRLVVIALKLAEADLFQAATGRSPVFLLDDLGSELDVERQRRLFQVLEAMEAQTFLTTTQQVLTSHSDSLELKVEKGCVIPVS